MSDSQSPEHVNDKMEPEHVEEEEEYEEEEAVEEEVVEEEEEKQQEIEGESGDEQEEAEEGNELTDYVIQHGAHREFKMRQKFMVHEAKKAMKVKDGLHIGTMLNSKAGKVWEGMRYFNIHIVGGTLKTTGKYETAPFVCFDPGEDVDTDDKNWLRPIWSQVMAYWQPKWRAEIKERYSDDKDKMKRILKQYKDVLEWSPEQLTGPKLNPQSLGVGKNGLVVITDKLKSLRINPEAVPRGQAKAVANTTTKLTSAIQKGGKSKASSSNNEDASDYGSDITTVGSHTVRIGDAATTTAFVSGGVLYATFLHA